MCINYNNKYFLFVMIEYYVDDMCGVHRRAYFEFQVVDSKCTKSRTANYIIILWFQQK